MSVHRQAERGDIHLFRNHCAVPANEEPVVGREDALIEDLEWRLEQRRVRWRMTEAFFVEMLLSALVRSGRQAEATSPTQPPSWLRRRHDTERACRTQKVATA